MRCANHGPVRRGSCNVRRSRTEYGWRQCRTPNLSSQSQESPSCDQVVFSRRTRDVFAVARGRIFFLRQGKTGMVTGAKSGRLYGHLGDLSRSRPSPRSPVRASSRASQVGLPPFLFPISHQPTVGALGKSNLTDHHRVPADPCNSIHGNALSRFQMGRILARVGQGTSACPQTALFAVALAKQSPWATNIDSSRSCRWHGRKAAQPTTVERLQPTLCGILRSRCHCHSVCSIILCLIPSRAHRHVGGHIRYCWTMNIGEKQIFSPFDFGLAQSRSVERWRQTWRQKEGNWQFERPGLLRDARPASICRSACWPVTLPPPCVRALARDRYLYTFPREHPLVALVGDLNTTPAYLRQGTDSCHPRSPPFFFII